ncbi:MAG: hypothetical protein IPP27_12375 [Bacteroidetes bacterium]|nr:hypothetical protein [Bacteroidota bacterium]
MSIKVFSVSRTNNNKKGEAFNRNALNASSKFITLLMESRVDIKKITERIRNVACVLKIKFFFFLKSRIIEIRITFTASTIFFGIKSWSCKYGRKIKGKIKKKKTENVHERFAHINLSESSLAFIACKEISIL